MQRRQSLIPTDTIGASKEAMENSSSHKGVKSFLKDVYPGAKAKPTMLTRLMTSDKPKLYIQNEAVLELEEECDSSSNADIVKVLNKQLKNDSCPDYFNMVQGSGYCIHESKTKMTYNEASQYCTDVIDSKILYLDSFKDVVRLDELLQVQGKIMFILNVNDEINIDFISNFYII